MKTDRQINNKIKETSWEKVYRGGGAHLERVKTEYEESGFETKILPVPPTECEGCTKCYRDGEQLYRLYVRKKLTDQNQPGNPRH